MSYEERNDKRHDGYLALKNEPDKNQITGGALSFLLDFITTSFTDLRRAKLKKNNFYSELTEAQEKTISLMAEGLENEEIASKLGLSISQVFTLIAGRDGIYKRYGLKGKNKHTKAVLMYLKNTGRL